tara:strand:+ start:109 stop:363 length:255 start_codon:yes stop_codon:yes gene_type:complete
MHETNKKYAITNDPTEPDDDDDDDDDEEGEGAESVDKGASVRYSWLDIMAPCSVACASSLHRTTFSRAMRMEQTTSVKRTHNFH